MYIETIHVMALCKTVEEFEAIEALRKRTFVGYFSADAVISEIGKLEVILTEAEKDEARKEFCDYIKNLVRKGKAKLKESAEKSS